MRVSRDNPHIRSAAATPDGTPQQNDVPGSTDPLSDQERTYLTLLFNKYRGSLHRYLSGLVRSMDDVSELVQETYFRVMRHTETVKFESVARSYLFQTATNVAREYYRRRSRHRAGQHVEIEEAADLPNELSPEQDAVWEEAVTRLRAELREMPEELRTILILNRFQHRTYPEIARMLGVSTRTVERRLSQAMDFLAARMQGVL